MILLLPLKTNTSPCSEIGDVESIGCAVGLLDSHVGIVSAEAS
jgi:hypothetical protein